MKGKLSLKNKIIIIVMVMFLGAACLFISLNKKQEIIAYAASPIFESMAGDEYSAKFNGDVILSAEKVIMSSSLYNETYARATEEDKALYLRTENETGGEERWFKNYYDSSFVKENDNNDDGKYVIEDNSFVMFNNIEDTSEEGKYIVSGNSNYTEAIIISIGQYVYNSNNKTVEFAEKYDESAKPNPTTAKITDLKVSAMHNGVDITSSLPGIRNIKNDADGRWYYDFMHIIPQVDGMDGLYDFTFSYMINGVLYENNTFRFYLMFKSSYTGTVKFEDEDGVSTNNVYNIEPTLGWNEVSEFKKTTKIDGSVRYFAGVSGINNGYVSYPTITYDYSKYKFSYTHTANGKEVKYSFDYTYETNYYGDLIGNLTYYVTSKDKSVEAVKNLQYVNEYNKLVTIVLTDPGAYKFEFEYIYLGHNQTSAPEMNLDVEKLPDLYLHGAELNYSKYNYQSAEMRYLQVSNNENDKVDVIFPTAFDNFAKTNDFDTDGKDISDFKNNSISFIYELKNKSELRVGDVIVKEEIEEVVVQSKDTIINASLKNRKTIDSEDDYIKLTNLAETIMPVDYYELSTNPDNADIIDVFKNIDYEKTNQGSLWLSLNDKYTTDSYYFYSTTKIDSKEKIYGYDEINSLYKLNKNVFNSETTFNKTGYYIVFLKLAPNAMTQTNRDANSFYYIYAFEYSTNTISINVKTDLPDETKEEVVGAGKFTKENVSITWKEPDVFERAISAYYYTTTNTDASRTDILKTEAHSLSNGAVLGNSAGNKVENNKFLKFLIELKSEGESATYKMFTIDRQPISGVDGYVVSKNSTSNNQYYYDYTTDVNGNYKALSNAITDSFATLYWADKLSGAEITTTYTFTPFVKSGENGSRLTIDGKEVLTTDYKLGSVIGNFNLTKTPFGSSIDFANVLTNQGIYVFTLTDEAGNSCKYAFVIDKTEAWFYADDTPTDGVNNGDYYSTGNYVMFANSFNYEVANYKSFKLTLGRQAHEDETAVNNRNAIIKGLFNDVEYYNGSNTNKVALTNLFSKNGGEYYITVRNLRVSAYDPQNNYNSNITGLNGVVEYNSTLNANTSFIITIYVKGQNNIDSSVFVDNKDSASYITFEINTDNAKGMVFYSSSQVTDAIVESFRPGDSNRLISGSDKENGLSGIQGAHATNSEYLVFTWQVGSGSNAVKEVYYDHYSLNMNSIDPNYYFYNKTNSNPIYIYKDGNLSNGGIITSNTTGYVVFGNSSITEEGLYKVTRSYVDGAELGAGDVQTLSYYFIVDRNRIIDVSASIGEHIKISLLESETKFNNFNAINANTGTITADDLKDEPYGIYLNTTKLPATLQIPAGKYFDGVNYSNYYSGKLGFKLYFEDEDKQLLTTEKRVKIFDSEEIRNESSVIWEGATIIDGYYYINIYDYISKCLDNGSSSNGLRSKLCVSVDNKNWISLPGIYVLYIYDTIEPTKYKELLGFRINKGGLPNVDFASTNEAGINFVNLEEEELDRYNYVGEDVKTPNYLISTNDEFIKLTFPEYVKTETKLAQVDNNYLVVTKVTEDSGHRLYINHEYKNMGNAMYNIMTSGIVEKDNNGFKTVLLETDLRDNDGNIIKENFKRSLYYIVTIRYKVGETKEDGLGGKNSKYINCYRYFDANGAEVKWYYATYKIVIDRQAPTENVNNLMKSDKIIADYNAKNQTDTMFENDVHKKGNDLYFTHQYTAYYQSNKTEKLNLIYALDISPDTVFDKTDVKKVLFQKIPNVSEIKLSLPIDETSFDSSGRVTNLTNIDTYSDVLGIATGVEYYQIIEFDAAGNTTQYVVRYHNNIAEDLKIVVNASLTTYVDGVVELFDTALSTIIEIKSGNSVDFNSYFFKIEAKGGNINETILTDFSYNFSDLPTTIAKLFENVGSGKYTLTLTTRKGTKVSEIMLYSEQQPLNVEGLIQGNSIVLYGANHDDTITGVRYFAKEIKIVSGGITNIYITTDAGYNYYLLEPNDGEIALNWNTGDNITYKITLVDVFDNVYVKNYNTINGEKFYKVYFEGLENSEDIYKTNVYYSYQTAYIQYDETVANSFKIYENNMFVPTSDYATYNIEYVGNIIKFNAYFNESLDEGKLYNYRIQFYNENGEEDEAHNIIIDTRIPKVTLRDYATLETRTLKVGMNIEEDLNTFISDKSNSSVSNLNWLWPENENLFYSYTLRVQDGTEWNIVKDSWAIDNNASSYVVSESGTYQLIINVYADAELTKYLGNKVYAFNHSANDQLYIVKDANGMDLAKNSTFKYAEVRDDLTGEVFENANIPSSNLPLYITRTIDGNNPNVVISEDITYIVRTINNALYTFNMYELKTSTYYQYFGVLIIVETSDFIADAKIGIANAADGIIEIATQKDINENNTSFKFVNNSAENIRYAIQLKQKEDYYGDGLLRKNGVVLEIYYNNSSTPVKTVTNFAAQLAGGDYENILNYEILGNGYYNFVFKDLAGNIHEYGESKISTISADIHREVIVTIDNTAPVDNAFYNNPVELRIYASAKYVTGSLKVEAELNGKPYAITSADPYVFEDYGSYKVTIYTQYSDENRVVYNLVKVIRFTIINENEVRSSIDLTTISNYKILKFTDANGNDVTNVFNKILNVNEGANAMVVSYDKVLNYSNELNIATGKLTYEVTYLVEGMEYPPREISFKFTLNNETPKIDCDLEIGKTTTKGFTISFNPGILYEQIGEAYVTINGVIVSTINADSEFGITNITRTFDADGDGDYYIQLVGTSGNIWVSYKATIKEPLNFWAVLIIIIVVVVVVGVTITIIVLRNKMRIR